MNETIIFWGIVVALIGGIVATYQLFRIRIWLGPLFQGELGTIVVEHILLGMMWMVVLFVYAIAGRLEMGSGPLRDQWLLALVLAIAVILWGFVFRIQMWYRRNIDED